MGIVLALVLIWLVPNSIEKAANEVGDRAEIAIAHITVGPVVGTDEMASRPLFMMGRRPVSTVSAAKPRPVPAVLAPVAVPTTDGIVLVGTLLAKDHNLALIRSGTSRTTALLSRGQVIGSWTVDEIDLDHVRLRTGAHVVDLKFSASAIATTSGRNPSSPQRWMLPGPATFPTSPFPR